MHQTHTLAEKTKWFFHIAWPILVTQVSLFAMNLFDTMMAGQVSAQDLAGVAIGAGLWIPVFIGSSGILLAMSPIISQLVGADRHRRVTLSLWQGIYLSIAISIIVIVFGAIGLSSFLNLLTLESSVRHIALHYLIGLSTGIIPLMMYTVLRCFIDALGQTRLTMFVMLIALPINVFFNYILIFGKWGFPALGGIGAGYASAITYWIIFLISVYVVLKFDTFVPYRLFKKMYGISLQAWKKQLLIGLPIGLSLFFEASIFSAVTLLLSPFGTVVLASHQVALTVVGIFYMGPLSISMALTIAVGYEVGAKRLQDARQYSLIGVGLAACMVLVSTVILYTFKSQIAQLFSNDSAVISMTEQFMIYAIIFQASDAIQSTVQGALRGYKDVNFAFLSSLVAYWFVGLPIGFALTYFSDLAQFGYWAGIIAGLTAGAIGVSWRLILIQRRNAIN